MGDAERVPHDEFTASMFDWRAFHTPRVKNPTTGELEFYDPKPRLWSHTTGITLHQTACVMGENIPRYNTCGAHFAVTRTGKVIRLCDLNRVIWHGHGWSNRCVGIEVDGLYYGIEGNRFTLWRDPKATKPPVPSVLTPEAAEATRQLCRWIVDEVALNRGKVGVLVAHRQSSEDRRNDPGQAIWQQVALPLHAEMGLGDGGVGFKIGTGFAIPEEWDPTAKGIKY